MCLTRPVCHFGPRVLKCALGLGLLFVLAVPVAPARSVRAEESGITITLSYVDGYSTWGPSNAYGTAHLWPHEGEIALTLHFLPRLPAPGHYVSWIVSRRSGQAMRLGAFNPTEAGNATQDVIYANPLPLQADTVLITAYPAGGSDAAPGPHRSVAGSLGTAKPVAPTPAPSTPTPALTKLGHAPHTPSTEQASTPTPTGGHANGHPGTVTPTPPNAYRRITSLPGTGGGPFRHGRPPCRGSRCRHSIVGSTRIPGSGHIGSR